MVKHARSWDKELVEVKAITGADQCGVEGGRYVRIEGVDEPCEAVFVLQHSGCVLRWW